MPTAHPIIPNLNGGEMSPWIEGRTDYAQYPKALRRCDNFLPLIQGPITKRPGTRFVRGVKTNSKKVRLIPFIFSDAEALILEFGDGYIRFFKNRAQVLDGGSPYEIASPYDEADLPLIRYAQSADVLYLAHPGYAPRKLTRNSDTDWTIDTIDFVGGPFLDEDPQGVTLTPASYGSVTPKMTSNTAPSGEASTSNGDGVAYQAFDKDQGTTCQIDGQTAGWLRYDFDGSDTKVADAYWLTAEDETPRSAPSKWTFQGYDGSTWVTLDTRDAENGWTSRETRFYEFVNDTPYEAYRLNWTAIDGDYENTRVAELGIHEKASTQTAFNLTASGTTGINGGAGFQSSDVGRPFRLLASDGRWRTAKIISRTSSTVVKIQLDGHALPNLSPFARWQIGAWSAYQGYPGAVTFYGDRLFWGGSTREPQTLWGSVVGDYENHAPGTDDDSALNLTLSSSDVNLVKWMAGDEKGLLVGASRGEWIIRPSSLNEALTPTNSQASRATDHGSSDATPQRVGKAVLFVQRAGRKLREMAYVIDVDGFQAPDLSIRAEHITQPSIDTLAYQSQPSSIIWAPRSDGMLLGFTYERDQDVIAWHKHPLGGYSDAGHTAGAVVESAAVIPAPDGSADDLWLVVRRYIDGGTRRYVEYMTQVFDHVTAQADAFFVDCGLTYDGAPVSSVSGLDHLEGETVKVLVDGATHPDQVVTDGTIDLDSPASVVQVGLGYRAHAVTERIEAGAADGTAQGRKKRIVSVIARLYRSGRILFGATDDELRWDSNDLRDSENAMDAAPPLLSEDIEIKPWPGGFETDGCIHIVSDDPTPVTILALMPQVETTG